MTSFSVHRAASQSAQTDFTQRTATTAGPYSTLPPTCQPTNLGSPPSSDQSRHPLASASPTYQFKINNVVYPLDQPTRQILLENKVKGETIEAIQGHLASLPKENQALVRSILAHIELHHFGFSAPKSGSQGVCTQLGGESPQYVKRLCEFINAVDPEKFRLDSFEALAINNYTDAHKGDPQGETYMGENKKWGRFGNGWEALASALRKLPSLGDLGLELTTYRVAREGEPVPATLPTGAFIEHGNEPMEPCRQGHFMSTGITYTPHMTASRMEQGVLAMTGTSGRFIQPFSTNGIVDGGEVLYMPGTFSRYKGVTRLSERLMLFEFLEVPEEDVDRSRSVSDHGYRLPVLLESVPAFPIKTAGTLGLHRRNLPRSISGSDTTY